MSFKWATETHEYGRLRYWGAQGFRHAHWLTGKMRLDGLAAWRSPSGALLAAHYHKSTHSDSFLLLPTFISRLYKGRSLLLLAFPQPQLSLLYTTTAYHLAAHTMGMKYRRYLAGERIYGCSKCKTHLATIHSMVSRAFNGQHGRAYLFDGVVNVVEGEPSDRLMTTGNHTVRDIYCIKCATVLGWKYDRAYEASQRYKEGKYILERNLLVDVQ